MQQDTNIVHQNTPHAVAYDTVVPQLLLRPVDSTQAVHVDTADYLLLCNDSVFAPYAADSLPNYRRSMFVTSRHKSSGHEPVYRGETQTLDWMFFVIVFLLVIMSIYINNIRFNLKDIFSSLFNQRAQERTGRENNVKIHNLITMTGIYLASVAAVFTRIATSRFSMHLTVPEPLFYIILFGVLIAFVLLRGGLIQLIGNIFNDTESTRLYLTSSHLFYTVGGMVLTPLLLFVYFAGNISDTAMTFAAIFIAIILILRFIRGLQLILTNSKSSKLYLFYYLCILEIVPILATVKIIIQ